MGGGVKFRAGTAGAAGGGGVGAGTGAGALVCMGTAAEGWEGLKPGEKATEMVPVELRGIWPLPE